MNAQPQLHILLLENEGLTRAGYRALLYDMLPQAVVLEAATYAQAVACLSQNTIQFALLDYKLSEEKTGLDVLHFISEQGLITRAIVLSGFSADGGLAHELVWQCLEAGAFGYIPKATENVRVLREALATVFAGKLFLPDFVTEKATNTACYTPPSLESFGIRGRLLEVFVYLCHAYPHKVIAKQLRGKNGAELSEGTVRNYAAEIFERFAVNNKSELLLKVTQLGIQVPSLQALGLANVD